MPEAQRQPSTLDATASILGALGKLGCLTLFLLLWIPFSAIIVYALLGRTDTIIVGLILAGIVLVAVDKARKQSRLWRCPRCNGTFQPFQGPSALCPHCHATVTRPPGAETRVAPSPTVGGAAAQSTRRCPDCAETVLAAARRCRYCGCELSEA